MTIFFTADLHLGHENLLKWQERTRGHWPNAYEMDRELLGEWRYKVKQGDYIYHLGDLSLTNKLATLDYLNLVTGHVFLISGNHDVKVLKTLRNQGLYPPNVAWLGERLTIEIDGIEILLTHTEEQRYGVFDTRRLHLHGHSHGNGPRRDFKLDVGWDAHRKILSWEEVRSRVRIRR